MLGVNGNSSSTEGQKVVWKASLSAIYPCKRLAKILAFPDAVAAAECRNINGVIDRVNGDTGNVERARSKKSTFPMPAVVTRSIETSAGKRACIYKACVLWIEGNATWRSGCQSVLATILPIATAIASNEQAAIIG